MSQHEPTAFDRIEDALEDIAAGKLVIVTDDEDRENEGDLVMAAEKATPETVNCMIRHARGLICVPTTDHQLRRLGINPMVQQNREAHGTAFTVSVDAADGISTGISAYDRTRTIRLLADPEARPEQLVQPGHVFPLRARPGGVLERAGHTEAAVDLASMAGLRPAGVICEILNEDGSCARLPELREFRKAHGLKLISIADLITYRHRRDPLVELESVQPIQLCGVTFELRTFRGKLDNRRHLAFCLGKLDDAPTLVRVHGENTLRDVFSRLGPQGYDSIATALNLLAAEGRGVLLYMRAGMPPAASPVAAMDKRDYGIGAQILAALGLRRIRLLTAQRKHVVALEGYGLEITEQIPLTRENAGGHI